MKMKASELRAIFERAGVGYIFDEQPERTVDAIHSHIEAVEAEYEKRYGEPLTLYAKLREDEAAMTPFVQALAAPMTTRMRVMVVRMAEGASVASLLYEYEAKNGSRLVLKLRGPDGQDDLFESDEFWDTEVLRHFGLMKVGDAPVIDGYFAFRVASAMSTQ